MAVPVLFIMVKAGWSRAVTFSKFYDKHIVWVPTLSRKQYYFKGVNVSCIAGFHYRSFMFASNLFIVRTLYCGCSFCL